MQTSAFGKSKGLWATLTEGSWSEAYAGFGASLVLVSNPAIQVLEPYHLLNDRVLSVWCTSCLYVLEYSLVLLKNDGIILGFSLSLLPPLPWRARLGF